MKFCQQHWDKLKAAIEARGLSSLVAVDGVDAHKRITSELKGEGSEKTTFEPLMGAHNAILSNVLSSPVGISVMYDNEDGTARCPLCFITSEHKANCAVVDCKDDDFEDWIDIAADEQLARAKKLGLVSNLDHPYPAGNN